MERFIRRENIKHYGELLNRVADKAERQLILKLSAEEQQKQNDAGERSKSSRSVHTCVKSAVSRPLRFKQRTQPQLL